MARIAGVDLPRNKRSFIALTYIYGIGQPRATRILDEAKVDPMKKIQDLGEDEVNRIRQVIEGEGLVEGDLPTAASGIAAICRFVDSARTPTLVRARVRVREPSRKRRRRRQRRKSSG